jgi:feruloyl esterase
MRQLSTTALAVLGIALMAPPASAQNGQSFTDAARSTVKYTQTPMSAQHACADIRRLSSDVVTVLSAEEVAASGDAPAFCRVLGMIQPEILIEVALPLAWNRRIYMRGNGGFAGEKLDQPARVAQRNAALRNGFVATQTNTGHDAEAEPLASFAQANHRKLVDYSFRAVHETIRATKRLATYFYGRPAAYSYFDGCSTGGRQGLMSAQRFPGDFDGIAVGAPVLNFVDTTITGLWNARALDGAGLDVPKMSLIADAVYKKCDAKDGLNDGVIDDPRRCDFDPANDLPKCAPGANDTAACFTPRQIDALKTIYSGPQSGGKAYFPGQPVGAEKAGISPQGGAALESGWSGWIVTEKGPSRQFAYAESFMRHMAFARTVDGFDWRKFDFDKDPARMDAIRRLLNANDADLRPFKARGGRILMYFGWADTALNPLMGIDYYERVNAAVGTTTPDFMRLFMVPGMFHCRGGIGADRFDALTPLIEWVENGAAPERLNASRVEGGKTVRTRPLCPYPQAARHDGKGSPDDAASFSCAAP